MRMISSYIFVAIVFKDLLETYDMYLWMRMFPIIEEHEEFKMQQFLDKSMDDIYEGTLIHRPISGMTKSTFSVFSVCILMPKALLAVLVLVSGSGLVLRSVSNYDLILNALAATFIMDLDEHAYSILVPNSWKSWCITPPFGLTGTEMEGDVGAKQCLSGPAMSTSSIFGFWLTSGAIIVLTSVVWASWCE